MAELGSEKDTADFYALLQYPGPDALVTRVWANRLKKFIEARPFKLLDAGCGSGRHTAGFLLVYPGASAVGIDISEPSLQQARALMDRLGLSERAAFLRMSFSEPLELQETFDVVLAVGTIHHSRNPLGSMINLANALKPEGLFAGMLYGARGHARRYEIKELLHIMSNGDYEKMQRFYKSYGKKYLSWIDKSPRQMTAHLRNYLSNYKYRLLRKESNFGYYFRRKKNSGFFLDRFATPIDHAFTSTELREMFDRAGLELIEMFNLGRPEPGLLPHGWQSRWNELETWEKIRVCELLDPKPESFSFVARKRS